VFSFVDHNWFSTSARGYVYNFHRGFLDRASMLFEGSFFVEAEVEIMSVVTNFTEKK
jgi:hypothetical protein